MSSIRIELDNPAAAFDPGDAVTGQVIWELDQPCTTIEIRLTWRTAGKGRIDSACVDQLRIDSPVQQGSHTFSFTLPPGPYSFSGQLISLMWVVEAHASPNRASAEQPIVLGLGKIGVVLASTG